MTICNFPFMRQSLRAVNMFSKHIVDASHSPLDRKSKPWTVMRLREIINHPKWNNAWLRLKPDFIWMVSSLHTFVGKSNQFSFEPSQLLLEALCKDPAKWTCPLWKKRLWYKVKTRNRKVVIKRVRFPVWRPLTFQCEILSLKIWNELNGWRRFSLQVISIFLSSRKHLTLYCQYPKIGEGT